MVGQSFQKYAGGQKRKDKNNPLHIFQHSSVQRPLSKSFGFGKNRNKILSYKDMKPFHNAPRNKYHYNTKLNMLSKCTNCK